VATGTRVLAMLDSLSAADGDAAAFGDLERGCADSLAAEFDAANGGFGGAPRFPSTANLDFLIRRWARDPARRAAPLAMVRRQLDAMRAGGIHDALGGGFHRYSTDARWLVPHFEKMLYDQALITEAYLDAAQATGEAAYAATARDVIAYVARELTSPGGAFLSAEDADSEGEEGRFYVWTAAQLTSVVGEADAKLFAHRWGVTPKGNFEGGASVLHEAHTLAQTAQAFGITPADAAVRLDDARARLLAARSKRPRPHRDDKVITSWNGLMIAACARAARALGEPAYAQQGARAAEFVWAHLRAPDGALRRRWCAGEAAGAGQLDDYACYARGLLELYAATHDAKWLERAAEVTTKQVELFWDEHDGAFFESPPGDASVRVRMKNGFDGAEPAANSVAAANLVRLASLLEREDWHVKAKRLLDYHARRLRATPWAMPGMLVAMDLSSHPARHVVIAGEPSAERAALVAAFERKFRPFDALIVVDEASRATLSRLVPFTATLRPQGGRPTAFVCIDYACRLPVTDPQAFALQLEEPAGIAAGREKR